MCASVFGKLRVSPYTWLFLTDCCVWESCRTSQHFCYRYSFNLSRAFKRQLKANATFFEHAASHRLRQSVLQIWRHFYGSQEQLLHVAFSLSSEMGVFSLRISCCCKPGGFNSTGNCGMFLLTVFSRKAVVFLWGLMLWLRNEVRWSVVLNIFLWWTPVTSPKKLRTHRFPAFLGLFEDTFWPLFGQKCSKFQCIRWLCNTAPNRKLHTFLRTKTKRSNLSMKRFVSPMARELSTPATGNSWLCFPVYFDALVVCVLR